MYNDMNAQGSYGMYPNPNANVPSMLGAKTADVPALERVAKSLNEARQQVADLSQRARSIADSVFGAMPETGKDQGYPPAAGRLGAIENETSALYEAISALRTQIDRLTCI